jgi:hypothetical protein
MIKLLILIEPWALALCQDTGAVDLGGAGQMLVPKQNFMSLTLYLGLAVLVRVRESMQSNFMKYEC